MHERVVQQGHHGHAEVVGQRRDVGDTPRVLVLHLRADSAPGHLQRLRERRLGQAVRGEGRGAGDKLSRNLGQKVTQ